jgi:hypothetical protein
MVAHSLSLAALASSVVAAATSGDFNVLSFNVAGLPSILNDNSVPGDKATNAGTIGTLFAEYDYDVIHVQEDFAYHAVSEIPVIHQYSAKNSLSSTFMLLTTILTVLQRLAQLELVVV